MFCWNGRLTLLLKFYDSGSHTSLCRKITRPSLDVLELGSRSRSPGICVLTSQVVLRQEVQRELSGSSMAAFIRIFRNKGPTWHHNVLHPGLSRNCSVHSEWPDSGPGWAWRAGVDGCKLPISACGSVLPMQSLDWAGTSGSGRGKPHVLWPPELPFLAQPASHARLSLC